MAANTSLNLVDLDFDLLKTSLKTFLRGQDHLKDYDFDGSSMNVLLDLLSHNTQKNAFYLNMALSEAFLDSAQMKDSVLSKAKELNYTPRSARSAKARISVSFTATGENQPYVVPKGSSFASIIKNNTFVFSVPENIVVASANTTFSFETDVYEGAYFKDSYIFKSGVTNQRFRLTNRNVDTTSLSVKVFEDGSATGDTYVLATTLLDLNEKSKVYFLQASENGYYEILFGDGIIGRQPKFNSLVVLDYRLSAGDAANGAKGFIINFDPTGIYGEMQSAATVTTISTATAGAPAEDIESIRYYAPRHFQVQQRAVIPSDYEILLKEQFPEINAVSVYGGEELEPPKYGKVFIAVDIDGVTGLPDSKKEQYADFIQKRTMMRPVFVNASYSYFSVDSLVRYNINITPASVASISARVSTAIMNYNKNWLNDFACTLRASRLSEAIDSCDESIVSNVTRISVYKKIIPELDVPQNLIVNFKMKVLNFNEFGGDFDNGFYSSDFTFKNNTVHLGDDGEGNIFMINNSTGKVIGNYGTIDYQTGVVSLINLLVSNYPESAIKFYVNPLDKDISTTKDTIGLIEPDEINLNIEVLRE